MPVLDRKTLMGVISFYDVAKAVVDSQDFENRMLKAYIRDWPVEEPGEAEPPAR
jgi:CBS domain-containing protein